MNLYNYKTGDYEFIEGDIPDEKSTEYIPQDVATQEVYSCRIGLGDTPMKARYEALKANLEARSEVEAYL